MAALRKEAPTKSFFSSPSNTFKRLVNAFPKPQKPSPSQLPPSNVPREQHHFHPNFSAECEHEEIGEDEDEILDVVDRNEDECAHIPSSSAAEDAGTDTVTVLDDGRGYSSSGEDEYLRPRIRPDLLPHDFSAWQKSPSIASSTSRDTDTFSEVLSSSTSQERCKSQPVVVSHVLKPQLSPRGQDLFDCVFMKDAENTTQSEVQRSPSATASFAALDLHLRKGRQKLPDLKHDMDGITGFCQYGVSAAVPKVISDECWTMHSGASEDSRRSSVDGSCQQRRNVLDPLETASRVQYLMQEGAMHQHFGDMAPFIQSFRDDWDDSFHRNNFQHHASMVYTRAPSREALVKKVADAAKRVSGNPRRLKKNSDAKLEDQENQPRQARGPDLSCSPHKTYHENAVDNAKLQGQVKDLQRKLLITEGVLQSYHSTSTPKYECPKMLSLERKVGELEKIVSEKDLLLESAQETLTLKEIQIQAMQMNLRDAEGICAAFRARSVDNEEELMTLRCEVAALRWQIEVEAEKTRKEIQALKVNVEMHDFTVGKHKKEWEDGKTEVMKKMYLAALVVAKICPREECLALVHILRAQLQCLVKIPTMRLLQTSRLGKNSFVDIEL